MQEVDTGQAKLTALSGDAGFEVEYSIVFTTNLRTVRPGLPPVSSYRADVEYVRATNGRSIPEGEYLLHREQEVNRVKNLGFDTWHVLSWPM